MKSSQSIWNLLHNVKLMVKISSIFVAFLENMNLPKDYLLLELSTKAKEKISVFMSRMNKRTWNEKKCYR